MPHTFSMTHSSDPVRRRWSPTNRLLKRRDFTDCYDENQRFFSRHFLFFVRRRVDAVHNTHTWRVGFAVSKKVGNAVRRNRIKRLLREFFRIHGQALPSTLDLVVIAKKNTVGVKFTFDDVCRELFPILKKIAKSKNCDNNI